MKKSPLLENDIPHTQESQLRTVEKHTLRVLSGLHAGASIELVNNSWLVVGSGTNCDVILNEESITQQHFLIGYQSEKVSVRVLDGVVCVNHRQLSSNETQLIQDYEAVQVGSIHIAFGLKNLAKILKKQNLYLATMQKNITREMKKSKLIKSIG
jgi:Inner membrane component of T3SS, cytoplasmic domain